MVTAVAFVVAAAIGTAGRDALRERLPVVAGVPLQTLVPNAFGSLALGIVAGWSAPAATVVGTALLGSLTTFSTFADEAAGAQRGAHALRVVVVTVGVCVALAWIGLRAAG